MIKFTILLRRNPDMTHAEFVTYHREQHAPLFMSVKAVQVALGLGMDTRFTLETPLMWLTKAETWRLAHELGGEALTKIIIEKTHTCYLGDRTHRHDWGYGCGECPACKLRKEGFAKFR